MGRLPFNHGRDSSDHAHTVGHLQNVSCIRHATIAAARQVVWNTFQKRPSIHVLSIRLQFHGAMQISSRATLMGMAGMGSIKDVHQQHV